MAKKRYLKGDFFEGYSLLCIVCGLPDFRATHFINQYGGFELKKYKHFSLSPEKEVAFSWYYFSNRELRRDYYLILNKNRAEILMPALHNFDYLLLLYGNITAQYLGELLAALRKTPYVTAVFEQDLDKLKNGDLLIERNEFHALNQGVQ